MPDDFTSLWNLKNTIISKQKRKRPMNAENILMAVGLDSLGGRVRKVKGVWGWEIQLVVADMSQGCTVQCREYGQYCCDDCVWCPMGTGFIEVITS